VYTAVPLCDVYGVVICGTGEVLGGLTRGRVKVYLLLSVVKMMTMSGSSLLSSKRHGVSGSLPRPTPWPQQFGHIAPLKCWKFPR
jgi:hypothetical protein